MAPRKGLSFEEKRQRLQQLFTETADFFTLKELEKIASKRKGIGMFPLQLRSYPKIKISFFPGYFPIPNHPNDSHVSLLLFNSVPVCKGSLTESCRRQPC